MGLISAANTIFDAGAMSAGGSMKFIKKLTASSSATVSFVDGSGGVVLDATYKEYLFTFNNIHPATDDSKLLVNFRDGGTNYDATKTTTFFRAQHSEGGSGAELGYSGGDDLAQSTGVQRISVPTGNDNDTSLSGTLQLFSPSSTTFVKHFISNVNDKDMSHYSVNCFMAGYCNVTAAIDGVQFSYSTGNIQSGTIKMYGIK